MTKQKIAILGGGVGAMTSAFYLTSQPGWQDRFDVTVYQLGWRLGGKGASGRNREMGDRIEEHGFHIFFGYYENAFAMMRQLYAELGRNPEAPLATWDEAWKPWSYFVLYEEIAKEMVPWVFDFPRNTDLPGDGTELPTPWAMIEMMLEWGVTALMMTPVAPPAHHVGEHRIAAALEKVAQQVGLADGVTAAAARSVADEVRHKLQAIGHAVTDLITGPGETPHVIRPDIYLHLARAHAKRLPDDPKQHSKHDHALLKWLVRNFLSWVRDELSRATLELRRIWILMDITLTTLVGMVEDELLVPPVNWFKIDGKTFSDWLMSHGASETAATSPPVELCTKMNFAQYLGGFGAGSCLYFALRIVLTYKGAFAWRMQAGMGDTIFGPFYEVLRRRGVKFEFFHSVDELGVGTDDAGKPVIDSISIGVQAKPRTGEYKPLYDVKGLPCWPSTPLYDQLDRGEELLASNENLENWWSRWQNAETKVLARGTDFDIVVLGISIGAYPYICKQLIANPATPQFAKMVQDLVVTETIGTQCWFTPDTSGLGWTLGNMPICGTYWEPADTIADMSYLAARENWPPATVGSIQYLCAGLDAGGPPATPPRDDHEYPFTQLKLVKEQSIAWLTKYPSTLWPQAMQTTDPEELNWWLLVDPKDRAGIARFDAQFWIAEWNPSDRYVLSVPGSVWSRLPAAGSGYANMLMAGDWILTGLSQGCVEAAVMAGMHVSRALTGFPATIVGDHEPDGGDVPPAPPLPPRRAGTYIEYDGNPTPLQPYAATGVTMYNFVVEADYAKLQAILDQQLNLGGPTIYKPLGPFVTFVAAPITQIAATEPQAWMPEKDFGFWMPVLAGRQVGDAFLVDRPAFFIPYLWVDSYLPQQSGREVFGYEKGVGKLVNPTSPDDAAVFSIDAFVAPEFGAPGLAQTEWQWKRLVTAARRGGGTLGNLVREIETVVALGEAVIERVVKAFEHHRFDLPTLELLRNLLRDAVQLDIPMVYLKQFRDVADGRRACYQAIVESPNRMVASEGFTAGFLDGFWELAIEQFASVSMIDRLGLRVVDNMIPAAFQFWAKFSFTAEPGRVMWRAV